MLDRGVKTLQLMLVVILVVILPDYRCRRAAEDRFSDLRSDILELMEDENLPSVSVAVAQHGVIIWEESFGWANREKKVKATLNTMYELASIAKVFTTTALMVLKERGQVDLDSPVESYLGGVKIKGYDMDASGVTLRRIIQHTSGLPMYWGKPWIGDSSQSYSVRDMFSRYAILAFKPGERELYSNLGIAMLTYVIETVSGESYVEFLKRNVFVPLGLSNITYISSPATSDTFAQQYMHEGEPWTYHEGLYASAHDLVRFGMFHLKNHLPDQRQILSDSTLELMQTAVDSMSDFRLPWWVWEYKGYQALVFTGASGTIVALLPEADLAIVVLANRLQADTPRIARWIADTILDDFDESRRTPTRVQARRKNMPRSLSRKSLAGIWEGPIVTSERLLEVELHFNGTGAPRLRSLNDDASWGGWVETMPSLRGDYSGGVFSAYFPLRIPVQDTRAHDHWTWIYVGLDADTLRGYAVAHAAGGPHFGLPYYVKLVRQRSGNDD